ncbi:MAG: GNAT family N-acetyltransferase [Acidobacteriota bacterium]
MTYGPAPRIESASERDLPHVRALLSENRLPLAGVEGCLDGMRVARFGGRIVGLAALEDYGREGLLRSVVVNPEGRRAGLGARLVAAVTELARTRGVRRLYLLTEDG